MDTTMMSTGAAPYPNLFSPVDVGGHRLRNRIVHLATLTQYAEANRVSAALIDYHAARAAGGAAMSIVEGLAVHPSSVPLRTVITVFDDAGIDGRKRLAAAGEDRGCRMLGQLWHVGRISHPSLQPGGALPVAPSAIKPDGETFTETGLQPFVTPRALETREIPGIVAQFRQAAENALEAGFDGVEVHGANGYLLDQFLRDGTNRRDDDYGGSLENRARLLLQVTHAAAGVFGADRVGVRLSPVNSFNSISDSAPDITFPYIAERLNRFPLAYLHVVEQDFAGSDATRGFDRRKLRDAFKGTYIANGGYDQVRAEVALATGAADLIAFGKPFIANPDLPARLAIGAPLNGADEATFYGGDEKGYTDYPFLAPEQAQAA